MVKKKFFRIGWTAFFVVLFISSPLRVESAARSKLAILPFSLNAADDMAYLKEGVRTMLASRIAARAGVSVIGGGKVDKVVAESNGVDLDKVAQKVGADLLLSGSITALGSSVSIDANLMTVGSGEFEGFFAAVEDKALIIGAVDQLATEISSVISGAGRSAPKTEGSATDTGKPVADEAAPAPEDQSAHPDRIFKAPTPAPVPVPVPVPAEIPVASPAVEPEATPAKAAPTASGVAAPVMTATRSQFLDMEIQVIDVGDLFGEGGRQIVLADKQKIMVYSRKENQLLKLSDIPEAPGHVRIIALNLADLNNNGRDEIYVSAVSDNTPYSYAVEWGSLGFVKLFDRQRHYLRPLLVPGRGWGLYGQQADFDGPARPGLYKADPGSGELDMAESLDLPVAANIYEFLLEDFTGDGQTEIVVQGQDGELLLYNGGGEILWQGSADYGYTKRFLGKPYSGSVSVENLQVPTRLVAEDLNGDGRMELVVMENPTGLTTKLKTIGSFVGGSVKVLGWNGVTFTEFWTTGEIGTYIASLQVADARLYLGMVAKKSSGLFSSVHSFVATYGLGGMGNGRP